MVREVVSGQLWWGEVRVYRLVWDVEKEGYDKFAVEESVL